MRSTDRIENAMSQRGHDSMVTPESSMFGTRSPRPEGAGRHLLVVLVVSVFSLGLAIFFAERDVTDARGIEKTAVTKTTAG